MQRVMIVGQPGSGKSTLARRLGTCTGLPVVHVDMIHWQSGWIERSREEKSRLCREVEARDRWIFEGGHSATWPERHARADTLIWLDVPLATRYLRVLWRSVKYRGRTRPDLPAGCPERLDRDFLVYIWTSRHSARASMQRLYDDTAPPKQRHRLTSLASVNAYIEGLATALPLGRG